MNPNNTPGPARFDYGEGKSFSDADALTCPTCQTTQDIFTRTSCYVASEIHIDGETHDVGVLAFTSGDLQDGEAADPDSVRVHCRGFHLRLTHRCLSCNTRWSDWQCHHKGQWLRGKGAVVLDPQRRFICVAPATFKNPSPGVNLGAKVEMVLGWVAELAREIQSHAEVLSNEVALRNTPCEPSAGLAAENGGQS